MAQYFVDPAGGQSELDRFNFRWGTYGNRSVVDDAGTPAFYFPNTFGGSFFTFDEAGKIADCEILVTARTDNTAYNGLYKGGPCLRVSDTEFTGYAGGLFGPDRSYFQSVITGSGSALIQDKATVSSVTTYCRIRTRITGDLIKVRTWDVTDPEPAGWDAEISNTAIAAAGFSGIYGLSSDPFFVSWWSLGTSGDPAPITPPGQYFTDFSEETPGTISTQFTKMQRSSDVRTDELEAKVIDYPAGEGNTIDFTDPINNQFGAGHYFNPVNGIMSEGEVYTKFEYDTSYNSQFIVAHIAANFRLEGIQFNIQGNNLRIYRKQGVNGTSVVSDTLGEVSVPQVDNTWYCARCRYYGGRAKVKYWAWGDPEPVDWLLDVPVTPITYYEPMENNVAISNKRTGINYKVDVVGIGYGGADAPTAPIVTSPVTPVNLGVTNLMTTSARLTWEQG